jgi:hypothetical protein
VTSGTTSWSFSFLKEHVYYPPFKTLSVMLLEPPRDTPNSSLVEVATYRVPCRLIDSSRARGAAEPDFVYVPNPSA